MNCLKSSGAPSSLETSAALAMVTPAGFWSYVMSSASAGEGLDDDAASSEGAAAPLSSASEAPQALDSNSAAASMAAAGSRMGVMVVDRGRAVTTPP